MTDDQNKSLDVLGIKPVSEAVNVLTRATAQGLGAFLSRICLPAAEEFGFLLRDRVSTWRASNAEKVVNKAKDLCDKLPNGSTWHAHPRLVSLAIEQGSWCDDDDIQDMWGGLIASSCTKTGKEQDNLIFMNLLAQITSSEARLIGFCCESAKKCRFKSGTLGTEEYLYASVDELLKVSGNRDVLKLDLEIDHLREIGLLWPIAGIGEDSDNVLINPSSIALQLYVRCQGHVGSPLEYFDLHVS
ncbi:MAG: Abi-alpha family protein [Acidithiobacillus sp.]